MKGLLTIVLSIQLILSTALPIMSFGNASAQEKITNQQKTNEVMVVPENNQPQLDTRKLKASKALRTTTLPEVSAAPVPNVITEANGANERDVYSWSDLNAAMLNSSVNVIHIQADFKSEDGNTGAEVNRVVPMRQIKISGNGHTIDFRGVSFYSNESLAANRVITWEINYLTMYGRNFYGPFKTASLAATTGSYGAMIYNNVTYIGSQLTASYFWTIDFQGNIENHSRNSYKSPFDNSVQTTQGNQVNIEATDVVFRKDSKYTGTTENAGAFYLTTYGKMTLEDQADVTITSGGSTGEGGSYVLYLQGILKTGENSKLTINTSDKGNQYGIAIPSTGNGLEINNGANVTINSKGVSYPSIQMGHYTNVEVKDHATLNINAVNKSTSGFSLLDIGGSASLIIGEKGTLNAVSDGSATHNILNLGTNSIFKFANAKQVNLQFTNSALSSSAKLISIASGNLDVDVQDVRAWNRFNISGNDTRESDYYWTPMFDMRTSFYGTNLPKVLTGSSISKAMAQSYLNNFKLNSFSRVLYSYIDDVEIEILNKPNDAINNEDSILIKGTATPGAYIRLTGDDALPVARIPSIIEGSDRPELTANFTVIADENGNFEVKAKAGMNFTASNTIQAFAFKGGKTAISSRVVLDKTAPTADAQELFIVKGDRIPNARDFLTNIKDSNPKNKNITHIYAENYDSLSFAVGTHNIVLQIYDEAMNTRNIPAKLTVVNTVFGVNANNIKVNLSDLKKNTTDAQLRNYLLTKAQAKGWGIENNLAVDYTNSLTILNLATIKRMKPGSYNITASFDQSATKPGAKGSKIFNVNVLNDEAVEPTNPENPGSGKPDEQENVGTGQVGLLKLDYAPSKFDFGTVKYGYKSVDKNAVKTTSDKQWLQVSDDRAADDITNWSVQVAENHPLQSTTGTLLTGATIQVPKGKIYNQQTGNTLLESGSGALISKKVDISTTPSTIFKSDSSKGQVQQISTNVWNATDVLLHISGNQELQFESYTNTITWTLVAEP